MESNETKIDQEPEDIRRQRKVFELLMEAGDLDPQERAALFQGVEPEVVAEVRHLLDDYDETDRFLPTHEPVGPSLADSQGSMALPPWDVGTEVDGLRIHSLLGIGGMGQVYLAKPLAGGRPVAIKRLQFDLRSLPKLRQRFEIEQQAMERLDHPNVGRILGRGMTPDGGPYLVMEWIEGERITTYCDRHRLRLAERLALFTDLCRGVAHAHRRFLLHRDIKPSNVLVTTVDGHPVPKLIDFGIAKAFDVTVTLGLTGAHAIGTPTYMSPEALDGEREVDTRSDVFSLGVVLHELLVGRVPWGADVSSFLAHLNGRSTLQKPSDLLAGLETDDGDLIADFRRSSVPRLVEALRGDLDALVLRAIDSDVAQRTPSVDMLIAEIEALNLG